MALADNIVLYASSPFAMQRQMEWLRSAMLECGLHINPNICATLNIIADNKHKKWTYNPAPIIKLDNKYIVK